MRTPLHRNAWTHPFHLQNHGRASQRETCPLTAHALRRSFSASGKLGWFYGAPGERSAEAAARGPHTLHRRPRRLGRCFKPGRPKRGLRCKKRADLRHSLFGHDSCSVAPASLKTIPEVSKQYKFEREAPQSHANPPRDRRNAGGDATREK